MAKVETSTAKSIAVFAGVLSSVIGIGSYLIFNGPGMSPEPSTGAAKSAASNAVAGDHTPADIASSNNMTSPGASSNKSGLASLGTGSSALTPAPGDAQSASSEETGVDKVKAENVKPPVKTYAQLNKNEKAALTESRLRAREFGRQRMKSFQSLARDQARCANGDQESCKRVQEEGKIAEAKLDETRNNLSTECDAAKFRACLNRGDLDVAAAKTGDAATWYNKAKTYAAEQKARCDSGAERSKARCRSAEKTLQTIEKRETRLATADASSLLGKKPPKAGASLKSPHKVRFKAKTPPATQP